MYVCMYKEREEENASMRERERVRMRRVKRTNPYKTTSTDNHIYSRRVCIYIHTYTTAAITVYYYTRCVHLTYIYIYIHTLAHKLDQFFLIPSTK